MTIIRLRLYTYFVVPTTALADPLLHIMKFPIFVPAPDVPCCTAIGDTWNYATSEPCRPVSQVCPACVATAIERGYAVLVGAGSEVR